MSQRELPTVCSLSGLSGKYVLVRTSLNVPIKDGVVANQFRLMRALPTVNMLRRQGARVIMCSHLGDDHTATMEPVFTVLKEHLPLTFSPEVVGAHTSSLRDALKDGEVLLLENLRKDPREKQNDADFARALADLADYVVIDDFTSGHREHASIVGVPAFRPAYVGLTFKHEYEELAKTLEPKSPALFLLGGAKFDTKMPLVEKFLELYDHVFIGGALANDIFKARGYEVGTSLVSEISLEGSPLLSHPKLLVPVDVAVKGPNGVRVCAADAVMPDEAILDAGPETTAMLAPLIKNAKTILWNGPFGNYEHGFEAETVATARLIADSGAYSVLGGGDTIAAIESLGVQEKYSFLSTAGGAMLTFLELGTLPAIEAVLSSNRE